MHLSNPKELTKFKEMQVGAFPNMFSVIEKPLTNNAGVRPTGGVNYYPPAPGSAKVLPRAMYFLGWGCLLACKV